MSIRSSRSVTTDFKSSIVASVVDVTHEGQTHFYIRLYLLVRWQMSKSYVIICIGFGPKFHVWCQVNTSRNLMLSSSVPITTKSSSVNLNCLPVCQLFECSWNVLIWENLLCNSYCHYMYFISPSVCRREGYNSPITSRYHVLLYILLIHIFNHVSYLIPLITPGHTIFSN